MQCYKSITGEVNTYYGKNISVNEGYKPNATFWYKAEQIIRRMNVKADSFE